MKLIQLMAKAIGEIWSFATKAILIALIAAFVFFAVTVMFPDNVMQAIEIVKGLLQGGGAIVGSG